MQNDEKQKIKIIALNVFNNNRGTYENNAKTNDQIIFKIQNEIYVANRDTGLQSEEMVKLQSSLIKNNTININIVQKIPDTIEDGKIYMVVNDKLKDEQMYNQLNCLRNIFNEIISAGDITLNFNAKDENTKHVARIFTIVYNTRNTNRKRTFFATDNYESIRYNMEFSDEKSEKDNCEKIKNILETCAPNATELLLASTNLPGGRYNISDKNNIYTLRLHSTFRNEQDNESKYLKQIREISKFYNVYCQTKDAIIAETKELYKDERKKQNKKTYAHKTKKERNKIFSSKLNDIPIIGKYIVANVYANQINTAMEKAEKEEKKKNEKKDKQMVKEYNKTLEKEVKKNKLIDAVNAMKETDIINADNELEKISVEEPTPENLKNLDEGEIIDFNPNNISGNKNNIIELENEDDYFIDEDGFDNDSEKNNPKPANIEKKKEEEKEENLTHNDERNKESTHISKPIPPPQRKAPNRQEMAIKHQQPLLESQPEHDTSTKEKKIQKQKPAKKTPEQKKAQKQNIETLSFTEKTSKQDKKTPKPEINYLILILLFILGIFPSLIYYLYKKNEQETWRKNNNNATINLNNRPQSQQII